MDLKFSLPLALGAGVLVYYALQSFLGENDQDQEKTSAEREKNVEKRAPLPCESEFSRAQAYIGKSTGLALTQDQRLRLYGLYKQAMAGPCFQPQPRAFDMVKRAKWDAWQSVSHLSAEEAAQGYIELVDNIAPDWRLGEVRGIVERPDGEHAPAQSKDLESSWMSMSVSTLNADSGDPRDWEVVENIYHHASIGDEAKVLSALENGANIDEQDQEGRTVLHWAVDRNMTDLVRQLIGRGAGLEIRDSEGMTPLAYAVNCEYPDIVKLLVTAGANVHTVDDDGDSLLALANEEIKQLLR